jgi:hypothetical protein
MPLLRSPKCPTTDPCRSLRGTEYARPRLIHAKITTMQRYIHLDDRELAEAQDLME